MCIVAAMLAVVVVVAADWVVAEESVGTRLAILGKKSRLGCGKDGSRRAWWGVGEVRDRRAELEVR